MSAVAVAVWDAGVVVAADGVCSNYDTGNVEGLASKLIVFPERNAIIAWCGIGTFGHHINLAIAQLYPTFDDLLEAFPEVCLDVHDYLTNGRFWEPWATNAVSIVLAGYSAARQRHEAYRLVSYEKQSTNSVTREVTMLVPWTVMPIEYVYCSHAPQSAIAAEFGLDSEESAKDLAGLCIRFICANRAESGPVKTEDVGAGRFYNVGGFVQVAYLDREVTNTWIAHRWPEDVPGRPVDPTRGIKMPIHLTQADQPQETA